MEKKKGIMDYIFQFAGTYKSAYIKSVIFAVIGVIFFSHPIYFNGRYCKETSFRRKEL